MWALKYSEMNQECHVDAKLAKTKPQTNSSFFNKSRERSTLVTLAKKR